jgi:hypothetical protein
MLYVVLFEDNATLGADVRRRHMAAHLSFLEHNAARINGGTVARAVRRPRRWALDGRRR